MVSFYNIKIENGVFTAFAINEMNGVRENIEAKIDGSYHSSKDSEIIKATWGLVVEYGKRNYKNIPERDCVAWG